MGHRLAVWLLAASVLGAGFAGGGCARRNGDLLVVSTGDCQGYLEPCG